MYKLLFSFTLLLLLLLYNGCVPDDRSRSHEEPPTVDEVFGNIDGTKAEPTSPIAGLEVSKKPYEWLAHEGGTIRLPNGTRLNLPANAVVDAAGGIVSGRVTLEYREFQDVGEILLSGLSMHFDSAGLRSFMRSSGMLEIRANKNGEGLFLAPGKSIELIVPSQQKGPFNLYHFDDDDRRWQFVLSQAAEPKASSANQRKGKMPLPPVKPGKISTTKDPLNFQVRYEHFPELASYFNLRWAYAGITRAGSLDPEKEVWVHQEKWGAATLESFDRGRGFYMLNLRNDKESVKIIVKPVLEVADYEMAIMEYMTDKKIYDELKADYDRENAAFASRSQMLRKCAINQFGYYNWDLPISPTQFSVIEADFKTAASESDLSMVYLVLPEEKTVVAYPKDQWHTFRYMPASKNQVLAIGKSDRFYMLDSQDFESAKGKDAFTFSLRLVEKEIGNVQDLRELLGG